MSFTFNIYLPTSKQYSRYSQISSETCLNISKYIQNKDDEYVVKMFNDIAAQNKNVKLTKVDIFCILLNLRILCVSDTLQLVYNYTEGEEKKTQKVNINLYDVLDKVTNYNINYIEWIPLTPDCKIKLSPPRELVNTSDNILLSLISHVRLFNKQHDLCDIPYKEKEQVLNMLPSKILSSAVSYIKDLDEKYAVSLLDQHDETNDIISDIQMYDLRLFNDSFYQFLKLCYNSNLQDIYYSRYLMVKHMGFDITSVENKTIQDINTYINMYTKEIEDRKKAQEDSAKQSGGSISLPHQNIPGL